MKFINSTLPYLFLLLAVFFSQNESKAQQMPFLSSYNNTSTLYNPAAIGEGGISLIHRRQWLGFEPSIAPKTFVLNADFSSLLPFSEKVGLGVNIMSDKAHIFSRTNIDLLFAFHLLNEGKHRFSLGVIAGLLNQGLNVEGIDVASQRDAALYNANARGMSFDGGPGLYYQYGNKEEGGDIFSINLALPQLFTSDLNYDDLEQSFDNRFHLLAGVQYRKKLANFGLEPAILFRGTNGVDELFAKATFDLNVKALFLKDRLWLSAGTRLNGNSLLGGVGAEIGENINLQGIFEYHLDLGLTYEFMASYRFNDSDPDYDDAVQKVLGKLKIEKEDLRKAKSNLTESKFVQLRENLRDAENAFKQAQYSNITEGERKAKVEEAERYLAEAKSSLDACLDNGETGYNATWIAERVFDKAEQKNIRSPEITRSYRNIVQDGESLDNQVRQLYSDYQNLNNRIHIYSFQQEMDKPIEELVRNKNIATLKDQLAANFAKVPGTWANTKVNVWDAGKVNIAYTFPYIENVYELNRGLDARTIVVEHIAGQIQKLQNNGIKVSAVKLKMLFQDELEDMKSDKSRYPYLGEFGPTILGSATFYDTENLVRSDASYEIKKWEETSIADLACLKMQGVKDYLKRKTLPSSTPITFEITGPNYDESSSQTFVIELELE